MQKLKELASNITGSISNPQYYRKVLKGSFWSALKYLYTLLALVSFVYSLLFAFTLAVLIPQTPQIIQTIKSRAVEAYPENLIINIKDGQLSTNVPQPYYYRWGDPNETAIAVIDTNASIEDYQKYKNSAGILITKTAVVYPKNTNQTEVFFLNEITQPVTLDKQSYLKGLAQVEPYLSYFQPLLFMAIIFVLVFGTLIGAALMLSEKLIGLLIFSLLTFIVVTYVAKRKMLYSEIYKMAMHASTLPILFFSLLGLFNLRPMIPFGYSLLLSLTMAVIFHRLWTKTS